MPLADGHLHASNLDLFIFICSLACNLKYTELIKMVTSEMPPYLFVMIRIKSNRHSCFFLILLLRHLSTVWSIIHRYILFLLGRGTDTPVLDPWLACFIA